MSTWVVRPVPKPAKRQKASKGMRRRAPLKTKGGRMFPDRADEPYLDWLREQPCPYCIAERVEQIFRTEVEHIVERSRGGRDRGDTTPTCLTHRELRHVVMGPRKFAAWYRDVTWFTLRQLADRYERAYTKAFEPCP